MPARLEVALKDELFDPAGAGLIRRTWEYLGLKVRAARLIQVYTFDLDLTGAELERVRTEALMNPVTQKSSFRPLARNFDWLVWVGLRPGVKDNPGDTAKEAVEDLLGRKLPPEEKIFCSQAFVLTAPELSRSDVERLARELLANDLIQQWRVYGRAEWNPEEGLGLILPKVELAPRPLFEELDISTDQALTAISEARFLALTPADIPVIRDYFASSGVAAQRKIVGLGPKPTDVELEMISQARSDHCNHNTFRGVFHYTELGEGPEIIHKATVNDLFRTCIKEPTLRIQLDKDWVISVLWDNAGVAAFDDDWLYTITGETHNSPSNMEAYGGSLTGIVGVYRDPLGTGLGSKLILGTYGFCVGPRDYLGPLKPRLHPRRLLDGIIEGVKDGGNKSGIPTGYGLVHFDESYLGKCLVFVSAIGIMPRFVAGRQAWLKKPRPGDLVVMVGGRVGKDGIHGVTASSEGYSEKTPAGHVQIGDPYTQKKVLDFILEARDEGLYTFITDNGGGGLSSSVGESARLSGGVEIQLDKVPLKYAGLQPWEIWISESQERMTVALPPENEARFLDLAAKHAVEATIIGRYTESGKLHLLYGETTCAYVDVDFTDQGFPAWEFQAEWVSPAKRGLTEPVLTEPKDLNGLFLKLLASPNLAAKNWITRQYDHEVQGGAVIKPLLGVKRDTPADAVVYRPVLDSLRGLGLSQCLNPSYGLIDTYHMTTLSVDEAVRRLVAVGADPDQIGAVDNFCWPNIQHHPRENPDGKYKAAQLVRAGWALRQICLAYGVPLLSGKDSMYVDGLLEGEYGERRKVSGLCALQITTTGVVPDVTLAVTPEPKAAGDLVYVVGATADELGGSAYYQFLGFTGLKVPEVNATASLERYRLFFRAVQQGLIRSAKIVGRGGLAAAAALKCFAAEKGLALDLDALPTRGRVNLAARLFSETAGRFLVTVAPEDRAVFEAAFAGRAVACLGTVLEEPVLRISSGGQTVLSAAVADLKTAWLSTFGGL